MKNLKFDEGGIKEYHEFLFRPQEAMIATPLFSSQGSLEMNLKKARSKLKALIILEKAISSPRENKQASFDVRFLFLLAVVFACGLKQNQKQNKHRWLL